MKHSVETGAVKAKKTTMEMCEAIVECSTCKIRERNGFIAITLTGPLADLPSLKNAKRFSGRGSFIDKSTMARIRALDRMFKEAWKKLPQVTNYDRGALSVIVSNRFRARGFDTDNVFSFVKDWLEPSTKTSGVRGKTVNRGWGVGLVANDNQVSGGSYYAAELGWDCNTTQILIAPFSEVKSGLRAYAQMHALTGEHER